MKAGSVEVYRAAVALAAAQASNPHCGALPEAADSNAPRVAAIFVDWALLILRDVERREAEAEGAAP